MAKKEEEERKTSFKYKKNSTFISTRHIHRLKSLIHIFLEDLWENKNMKGKIPVWWCREGGRKRRVDCESNKMLQSYFLRFHCASIFFFGAYGAPGNIIILCFHCAAIIFATFRKPQQKKRKISESNSIIRLNGENGKIIFFCYWLLWSFRYGEKKRRKFSEKSQENEQ